MLLLTSLDQGLVGVQRGTYTQVSSDRLRAQRFLGVNADTLPSGDALVIIGNNEVEPVDRDQNSTRSIGDPR